MSNKPSETILNVAKENLFLRWTVLIMALSLAAMTVLFVKKPPQPIWLVSEKGVIQTNSHQVYSWEPIELLRRAFESMFVNSDNRETILPQFFTGQPLEAALAYKPDVRFTNFRIENQTISNNGTIVVIGSILRDTKKDLRLSVELVRSDRSEINPFGLKISSTTLLTQPQ